MIELQQLDYLADTIILLGLDDGSQQQIRGRFSDLKLTFCLEDELGVREPYRAYAQFNLYLVGESSHCLGLTDDPQHAGGVLIAEV